MILDLTCLDSTAAPKLCNGAGSGRSCWDFTPEFAVKFNEGHAWLINHTQNVITGPVVDGPYSRWHAPACTYEGLLPVVQAGQAGTGPYVIEASDGACTPDESCIAGFLMAAQKCVVALRTHVQVSTQCCCNLPLTLLTHSLRSPSSLTSSLTLVTSLPLTGTRT